MLLYVCVYIYNTLSVAERIEIRILMLTSPYLFNDIYNNQDLETVSVSLNEYRKCDTFSM